MADSIWGTSRRLEECLFKAPYEFEFFQAVRLLALMDSEQRSLPRAAKGSDSVRFAVETSMAFPYSSVVKIDGSMNGTPPRMTVSFLGLIGPMGVLPDSYTESAIHQKAFGDPSFAAFFDIFHHRLLALFYRAWEKHHFVIGYEQAKRNNSARDRLSAYLLDLIGMGTPELTNRLPLPDQALLRYAGLLAQRPRSAECLRAFLHDFLGVPIAVEQFLGRWHALDPEELCELGAGGLNSQLGDGAVAGDKVWSRQAVIRIVLGPLAADEFFQFLPDGDSFSIATKTIRWFLGPTTDFEMQPVIASGQVPDWCCLGDTRIGGPRLGWCSWLTEEPFEYPASEAVFAESERVCLEV
jgi:type VI secretion system protein ImpH